jgi:hypothetical protein
VIGLALAYDGESLAAVNARMEAIYRAFSPDSHGPLIASKTMISASSYGPYFRELVRSWGIQTNDGDQLVLLRLCILNPFCGSKEMDLDFYGEVVSSLGHAMIACSGPEL